MAAGEEPFRIGKPLQGGAGRYQVCPLREIKSFGITRQKADGRGYKRVSVKWHFSFLKWHFSAVEFLLYHRKVEVYEAEVHRPATNRRYTPSFRDTSR